MTTLGLEYLKHQATVDANRERERANRAQEQLGWSNLSETMRANVAREAENYRANTTKEREDKRRNMAQEDIQRQSNTLSGVRNDIERTKANEQARANRVQENLKSTGLALEAYSIPADYIGSLSGLVRAFKTGSGAKK